MDVFNIILLFFLGIFFGSFGGVLISRNWDKKGINSIFFGRSKCNHCDKKLSFIELIPILSFVFQSGRCKSCGKKLSHFYWIVEILSGLIFVSTFLVFQGISNLDLFFWIAINWGFLLLLIFDIKKHELHFPIWIFVTIVSLFFVFLNFDYYNIIFVLITFLGVFYLIYLFSRFYVKIRFGKKADGFGQGDVYFSATIGLLSLFVFDYNGINFSIISLLDFILIYIIISCFIGIVYASISLIFVKSKKNIIPFLPSMIVAFWLFLVFGKFLLSFV